MYLINEIGSSLKHLFFPHLCKSCRAEIHQPEQHLCAACLSELPLTGFININSNPVEKIFFGRVPIQAATSLLFFTPASIVQNLIHQIKYKGQKELALYLGKMMGRSLVTSPRFGDLDLVVPLPLFRAREKQRGFNQAALLARGIAEVANLNLDTKAIKRTRATETQTRKSRAERWGNVDGLFATDPQLAENQHILLVDDVITTGATLDACASSLLTVKGTRVSIFTLAYAMQ